MEKPVLKLAFCMGGGTSLGAFSGGALAETLRQLLYAEAKRVLDDGVEARQFSRIEIDAFMGASAGTITLALMLRSLAYSLPGEGQSDRDSVWKDARLGFEKVFGSGKFTTLMQRSPDLVKGVIGVERVDRLQQLVWVKRLSLDAILGEDQATEGAGLLNPAFFGELSSELAGIGVGEQRELNWQDGRKAEDRVLLADRVVFGGTVTSLHPLDQPAARNFPIPGEQATALPGGGRQQHDPALRGWISKGISRTARIFDIGWNADDPKDPMQDCWVRICPDGDPRWTGKEHDRTDVTKPEAWWEMLSTAITSGAFPGAFDPVVLRRHRHEFGWSDTGKGGMPSGLDQEEIYHDLPYVDGGAFNNEPLVETVRICQHLDAESADPTKRIVFYVDSTIPNPTPVRTFGYQEIASNESKRVLIGPRNRQPSRRQSQDVPDMEKSESGEKILSGLLQTLFTVTSHTQTLTPTQVLDADFSSALPGELTDVCAIGPVQGVGGVLVPVGLKGERLSAFGGFFRESWRRYDFEQGRRSVHHTFRYADTRVRALLQDTGWTVDPGSKWVPELLDPKDWDAEKEDKQADRFVKLFTKRIVDRTDEVAPDILGIFNRIFHRRVKKLIRKALYDPGVEEYRSFQLYLKGEQSFFQFKRRNIPGVPFTTLSGQSYAVFDLVVKYKPALSGKPDILGIYWENGWEEDSFFPVKAVEFESGATNSLDGSRFQETLIAAMLHGCLGVMGEQEPGRPAVWTLFQPENRIDAGFYH